MKDNHIIYPGAETSRDITASATKGRELIKAHPGSDIVLSELGALWEIIKDDQRGGWFDAICTAFDFGVYVGAQIGPGDVATSCAGDTFDEQPQDARHGAQCPPRTAFNATKTRKGIKPLPRQFNR